MSQHPSLLGSQKGKRHRSVLKRYEKLKHLIEKDKWDEKNSIYNLPKVKSVKFKVRKEKAAVAKEGAAVAQAAPVPGAGTPPSPQAQAAPGTKQPVSEKQAPPKEKKAKT